MERVTVRGIGRDRASGDVEIVVTRKPKLGRRQREPWAKPKPRDAGQRGTRREHLRGMRVDVKEQSCINPFSQEIAVVTAQRQSIRMLYIETRRRYS